MRRRWIIIIALVLLVATLALVLRIVDSESDNLRRAGEQQAQQKSEYSGIIAEVADGMCEVLVDFDSVAYGTTTVKNIRIVNVGTTPLVLLDNTTQCRCMWLEYSREPIAVGESIDISLMFDSRGEWGSVGNYMTITTSREEAPIVLWIAAEVQ